MYMTIPIYFVNQMFRWKYAAVEDICDEKPSLEKVKVDFSALVLGRLDKVADDETSQLDRLTVPGHLPPRSNFVRSVMS